MDWISAFSAPVVWNSGVSISAWVRELNPVHSIAKPKELCTSVESHNVFWLRGGKNNGIPRHKKHLGSQRLLHSQPGEFCHSCISQLTHFQQLTCVENPLALYPEKLCNLTVKSKLPTFNRSQWNCSVLSQILKKHDDICGSCPVLLCKKAPAPRVPGSVHWMPPGSPGWTF